MGLLRDDRGQAIQVGAAILLGFVVIAITMYQVQVVPSQNAEIEFDHSQGVRDDVQDLRNAVTNAGTRESSESVSVALGTRFPARTIFVNPPPAIGTLRTVDAGNVTIQNAELADSSSYGPEAAALLEEEHRTARIQYEPNYREYRGGPTTVVEHSLAYNEFDDAALGLTRQTAVRGDRLQLTLVDGELQEEGARSVTVDAETASGPSTLVPIQPADESNPIELGLPVAAPAPWNESIGTTYDDGEADARVAGYDENGTLTVELDRDSYGLRMARVGVGTDVERTDRYDVERTGADDGGEGGGSSPAYDVLWQDPSGQSSAEDENCDADRCVVAAEQVDLSVATAPIADGATVEYGLSNRTVAALSSSTGTTDSAGEDAVSVDLAGASDGETVQVYASSGSDGDRIELEVNESDGGNEGGAATVSTHVEDISHLNEDVARYYASFEVGADDGAHDRTAVAFRNLDDGTTTWENATTARDTVSLTDRGATTDEYEIEVLAYDASNDVLGSRTISDAAADGQNPGGNDDLGADDSPSLASSDVRDQSSNQNGVQYEVAYTADATDFGSVQLDLVSLDPDAGGRDSLEGLPSDSTETLSTYGYGQSPNQQNEFRVTVLVYDSDGVIVDSAVTTDVADGSGP